MTQPQKQFRVLFLCTANSARSQMAEALLNAKAQGRFIAASAGTAPADSVHPQLLVALRAVGIDWTGHRPKGLEAIASEQWDAVITTCDKARESCPTFPGRPVYAHWNIVDPAAADPYEVERAFTTALQSIARRIDFMLAVRLDQKLDASKLGFEETGERQIMR